MGSYVNSHFGYYILCTEKEIEYEENVVQCERNENHKVDNAQNYCSTCGGMVVTVPVMKTTVQSIWNVDDVDDGEEVWDKLTDQFIFPEYCPHIKGKKIAVSNFGAGDIEITEEDIVDLSDLELRKPKLLAQFMSRHEVDIELLRKYVYEDVEIKFGMFNYYL